MAITADPLNLPLSNVFVNAIIIQLSLLQTSIFHNRVKQSDGEICSANLKREQKLTLSIHNQLYDVMVGRIYRRKLQCCVIKYTDEITGLAGGTVPPPAVRYHHQRYHGLLAVPGGGGDGELGPVVHVIPEHSTRAANRRYSWTRVQIGSRLKFMLLRTADRCYLKWIQIPLFNFKY